MGLSFFELSTHRVAHFRTVPVPPEYTALERDTPNGILAEYPLGYSDIYRLWQRVHGRPLVNGAPEDLCADQARLMVLDPHRPGTAPALALLGVTAVAIHPGGPADTPLQPRDPASTPGYRLVGRFPDGSSVWAVVGTTCTGARDLPRRLRGAPARCGRRRGLSAGGAVGGCAARAESQSPPAWFASSSTRPPRTGERQFRIQDAQGEHPFTFDTSMHFDVTVESRAACPSWCSRSILRRRPRPTRSCSHSRVSKRQRAPRRYTRSRPQPTPASDTKPRRSRSSTMTSEGDAAASARPATKARRLVEEVAQDVRAHPREHGVLAEPFAPLRLHAMHEAREIEVVALLLAPAAVGDDERAAPLDAHEVEEAQPRDPHERRRRRSGRSRPNRSSAAIVTGWSMKSSGVRRAASASTSTVSVEQPAVVQQLEAVERDDAERPSGQRPGRRLVGHELEAVADRVRARVDDIAAAQVRRGPGARRVVDAAERRRDFRLSSSGTDAGGRCCEDRPRCARPRTRSERPIKLPEHRRHRVPVNEDERPPRPVAQRAPHVPSLARPRAHRPSRPNAECRS